MTTPSPDEVAVPLDEHQDLLRLREKAFLARDAWDRELGRLDDQLRELIGDHGVGTFRGEEVFTYRPINRFAMARFIKENPDLARHFMTRKMIDVVDEGALLAARPDLYRRYQTRQTKFMYEGARYEQ
jgi:hypothetical protein